MRVLFAVNPSRTVFFYMVPLAWALRAAGHEVRFATQAGFADTITQAGLTAVPVGRSYDLTTGRTRMGDIDDDRAGIPAPYDAFDDPTKANWEHLRSAMAGKGLDSHKYENFPIINGLVDYARSWEPDLVLWEPYCYAGAIAAKASGAAHARVLVGPDIFGQVRRLYRRLMAEQPESERSDPLADWLGSYGRKHGFEFSEDMITGQFSIDQFPKSLRVLADGLDYVHMRHVAYAGPAVVPSWLREPPKRPRIGFTMGLSATEVYSGYNVDMTEILTALSDLDVEVVATVAESEQAKLGRVPDNTRIVSFVPWPSLVPTCSAVVHHAGAATMVTTAMHPVPQLTLYYHFDQPTNARKLVAQGAGLALHTSEATGENVREHVRRLLEEPSFRERAVSLRDEILAEPSPAQLVPQLEALTLKHRTR
jgi:glycosyltransferase (activator-dependent family)